MKNEKKEYITPDQLIDRKIVSDEFITRKLSRNALKELYEIAKENEVKIVGCTESFGFVKRKYKIQFEGYDGAIAYLKVLYEDGRN